MASHALGLLHFNTFWDLNPRSGQRHCTEALSTVLNALLTSAQWRVSIELCGSSLEYLSRSYPELLDSLKILANRGQIELISALYTPNIWVAYPRRDLIRSIEANYRALDRLDLPHSRCFFAQEAFFGPGVKTLCHYFDTVICKDEFLTNQGVALHSDRLYRLGDLNVIVASDHIVNGLARSLRRRTSNNLYSLLPQHQIAQLELRAQQLGQSGQPALVAGNADDVNWRWYHCGDGNYFGTFEKPDQLDACYSDAVWHSACLSELNELREGGWTLSRIDEVVAKLNYDEAEQLPQVTEGSWNSVNADGVFCWMGRNSTAWEDDLMVLRSATQARQRIVQAEEMMGAAPPAILRDQHRELLRTGWEALLHAQISDALGWTAGPKAVPAALGFADDALAAGTRLINYLTASGCSPTRRDPLESMIDKGAQLEPFPELTLFGCTGRVAFDDLSPFVRQVSAEFEKEQLRAGLVMRLTSPSLAYSPSAMEDVLQIVPRAIQWNVDITLPLANGILQLTESVFIVKDCRYFHGCVRISDAGTRVAFEVEGQRKQAHSWKFYLLRTADRQAALSFANKINLV